MIKRTIEISSGPVHLSLKNGQMLLRRDGETLHSIPVEDMGLLILSHPAISYTHGLLYKLLEFNVATLFCNKRHLPEGLLLPFQDNQVYSERLRYQSNASKPLKKRLWQQVVRAKIRAQSDLLKALHGEDDGIRNFVMKVHSGDPENIEATVAVRYWKFLFQGTFFKRRREENDINSLLNYGYTIVRAAVARSLTAAGLHPSMGIHHRNKYNPYCLADDMMEPLRPMVDAIAYDIYQEQGTLKIQLLKSIKKPFLKILAEQVTIDDKSYPLMESLHLMATSLVDCYMGDKRKVMFPIMNFDER
jgi:CRISPR-associated protein Cas1